MKKESLVITLVITMIIGCQSEQSFSQHENLEANKKDIPVYRLDKMSSNMKTVNLSQLFKSVEIVPLRGTKENKIEGIRSLVSFTKNSIMVADRQGGRGIPAKVFEYSLDGKLLRQINSSPADIKECFGSSLRGIGYNQETQLTVVQSSEGNNVQNQVFDNNGRYIKSIMSPFNLPTEINFIGRDMFLSTGTISGTPINYRDSIFLIWFDCSGQVLKKIPRNKYPPNNLGRYSHTNGQPNSIIQYNGVWHMYSPEKDTIYEIKGLDIKPIAALKTGNNGVPWNEPLNLSDLIGKHRFHLIGENSKFWYLRKSLITSQRLRKNSNNQWGGTIQYLNSIVLADKNNRSVQNIILNDDLLGLFPPEFIAQDLMWDNSGQMYLFVYSDMLLKVIEEAQVNHSIVEPMRDKINKLQYLIRNHDYPVLFLFKESDI